MCVSQFRSYCNASKFNYANRETDMKDKDLKVKQGTYHYNGRNWYYVTDLNKMKRLAKQGNQYAINELEKRNERV